MNVSPLRGPLRIRTVQAWAGACPIVFCLGVLFLKGLAAKTCSMKTNLGLKGSLRDSFPFFSNLCRSCRRRAASVANTPTNFPSRKETRAVQGYRRMGFDAIFSPSNEGLSREWFCSALKTGLDISFCAQRTTSFHSVAHVIAKPNSPNKRKQLGKKKMKIKG